MHAEVIAVGTELLLGDAVDTNSAWISSRLAEVGVDVFRHVTVGDNLERLAATLREAVGRADVVVVTGGLGPTQDDLTRDAVAALCGVELVRDESLVDHITERFRRSGRAMPERNLVQADVPAGAKVLAPVGTAAGFAAVVGRARLYCLPGVPAEMRQMFDEGVLPDLREREDLATTVSRVVRTAGMAESAVADAVGDLVERLDAAGNPTIAFLASRGETRVRITAKAPDRQAALDLLEPVVDEVLARLGPNVTGLDDEGAEHAVARQLRQLGLTLALAESVTGGGVGARLVRVPGASAWLRGGLVAYATRAKAMLAGVDAALLDRAGPVAEEVAGALAAGARERLEADVGLAVVGVAGPDTQGDEPVGATSLGVALPDGSVRTRHLQLPAYSREQVQDFAASAALDYLRRRLAELG